MEQLTLHENFVNNEAKLKDCFVDNSQKFSFYLPEIYDLFNNLLIRQCGRDLHALESEFHGENENLSNICLEFACMIGNTPYQLTLFNPNKATYNSGIFYAKVNNKTALFRPFVLISSRKNGKEDVVEFYINQFNDKTHYIYCIKNRDNQNRCITKYNLNFETNVSYNTECITEEKER